MSTPPRTLEQRLEAIEQGQLEILSALDKRARPPRRRKRVRAEQHRAALLAEVRTSEVDRAAARKALARYRP